MTAPETPGAPADAAYEEWCGVAWTLLDAWLERHRPRVHPSAGTGGPMSEHAETGTSDDVERLRSNVLWKYRTAGTGPYGDLDAVLADGWEPFAVTAGTGGFVVHLKAAVKCAPGSGSRGGES